MKNKEKLFCESAQRTKSYVTDEQKGFDTVIRQHHNISILSTAILSEERNTLLSVKLRYLSVRQGSAPQTATLIYKA